MDPAEPWPDEARQRQVYLEDTYAVKITTAVLRSGSAESGPWVVLHENLFHPQGGASPATPGRSPPGQPGRAVTCGTRPGPSSTWPVTPSRGPAPSCAATSTGRAAAGMRRSTRRATWWTA